MSQQQPAERAFLIKAIELLGSEAKLAAATGVTQAAINNVKRRLALGYKVSAELAVRIENATDGKVTREQLRPDLYLAPRPSEGRAT